MRRCPRILLKVYGLLPAVRERTADVSAGDTTQNTTGITATSALIRIEADGEDFLFHNCSTDDSFGYHDSPLSLNGSSLAATRSDNGYNFQINLELTSNRALQGTITSSAVADLDGLTIRSDTTANVSGVKVSDASFFSDANELTVSYRITNGDITLSSDEDNIDPDCIAVSDVSGTARGVIDGNFSGDVVEISSDSDIASISAVTSDDNAIAPQFDVDASGTTNSNIEVDSNAACDQGGDACDVTAVVNVTQNTAAGFTATARLSADDQQVDTAVSFSIN